MGYLIVNWVLSSFALFALANLFPGFRVLDLEAALIAAGVVGLISAFLGTLLKYATGFISLAMSGAFLLILDTFLFRVSALLVPGFAMRGFAPALAGALLLLALNLVLVRVIRTKGAGFDSGSLLGSSPRRGC